MNEEQKATLIATGIGSIVAVGVASVWYALTNRKERKKRKQIVTEMNEELKAIAYANGRVMGKLEAGEYKGGIADVFESAMEDAEFYKIQYRLENEES